MEEIPNDILADIRHVTYTHWNQSEPTLVDLSLQLRRKTLNVLVGPGGSGKSTVCTLFNGEIPHLLGGKFEGEVIVAGVSTHDTEVRDLARRVGHVFQDPESMFATLTVEDEVAFGPENLRQAPVEIQRLVADLLEKTQLTPFRDHLVWALSGGQVQKLGLAAVLAMQPELIILDEPTSNLDPAATRFVHELLLALREQGMTILLVTRELDDFLARADQLLVLERGRLIAAGEPREVLASCGETMLQSLGIWLPETSEIGVAINSHGAGQDHLVPITVDETLDLLREHKLLERGLVGRPPAPPVEPGERLISARSLSYTYGGEKPALADVSLDIYAGELLAIVGRNGAGKSTLARMMVGLLKPQAGSLDLFGRPAAAWKVQDLANQVALVFQNPEHQFLTDSVSEEIQYSLLARGVTDAAEREKAVHDTLDRLGICGFESVHPFALSAGMKRRLGVATMLVCRPAVLLVDEPTYGQDKQMTQTLMALMEEIRSQGVAVVMITHDMRLVQEFASRVVVMSEGRVCYDGSPVGLFARGDVLDAANLCPTMLHQLMEALHHEGVPVEGEIRNTADFLAGLGMQPGGGTL